MERLPPPWCSKICKNSMSDVCVEDCAVERRCKNFDVNNITFHDLSSYPVSVFKEMTKEEKAISLAVYVSKIVEYLKGGEDEHPKPIRQNFNRSRSGGVPSAVQVKNIFPYTAKENSLHPSGEKRPDLRKRSEGVDK
jgi:hypothetical protein